MIINKSMQKVKRMANFYEDLAGDAGSDASDVSDINPTEMAKMLQDLDDIDDALFKSKKQNESKVASGKSSKKMTSPQEPPLKTEKPHVTFDKQKSDLPKKKVLSKKTLDGDFDWDDPLGDILSSDESTGKSKTSANKQIAPKEDKQESVFHDHGAEEKNIPKDKSQKEKIIANLFGLEDTSDASGRKQENIVNKTNAEKLPGQPKSLESYLDKKSPITADTTMLTDKLDATKLQTASDAVMLKKNISSKTTAFQKKADQVENDDLLMDLGLETDRKSGHNLFGGRSATSKSKSVMDDIFIGSEKNVSTNDLKKNQNKQETLTEGPVSFGNYAPSLVTTRESRRAASRRETSTIGDPLGLFSPPTTPQRNQTVESSQKPVSMLQTSTPRKKSLADIHNDDKSDWLGLSVSKEEASYSLSPEHKRIMDSKIHRTAHTEPVVQQHSSVQSTPNSLPEWLGGTGGSSKQKKDVGRSAEHHIAAEGTPNVQILQQSTTPVMETGYLPTAHGIALQTQNQMEQEAAYALQLQEQQLRAALKMRQHEAQLASVHERQHTLLQHQEQQMQQLLFQQTQRQQLLEQQLQLQQQRIAEYMQALMVQPPTALPSLPSDLDFPKADTAKEKCLEKVEDGKNALQGDEETQLTKKEIQVQLMELQVALQQSELEKKALESTLDNLQIKHKEEVQLMEDCYKRQVSIIEEAMVKHDERLKTENQRMEEEYKERLSKVQDQHAALIENHTQQLSALHKDHLTDMQALKDQHSALLDHVRHIQHAETSAVKEASQNMTILHSTVEQLGRNTSSLNEMQRWLEKQSDSQTELRELALKTKEAEVQAYKDNLMHQRESAEEERRKLLSLVEQLDLQVAQQRSKAEEERYTLRQEAIRLDSRVESFEKEKEHVKAELERERQHLEKARQVLLEEQKTVSMQLKEEKLSIAKERARIQALTQLQGAAAASEEQVLQLKAEAEAALTVAKEATEQVEAQKNVIHEQQRQLERERQRLQELEHTLTIRAHELEALTKTALATRNEGAVALATAVEAEERQKHQAMDLQRQLNEVKEREQRLAEERMSLSQERMKIHRHREQKMCSFCKGSLGRPIFSVEQSQMIEMEPNKYIDPKKVILKLVAEKERDALLSNSQHFSAPK